jgi:hypothetical protein
VPATSTSRASSTARRLEAGPVRSPQVRDHAEVGRQEPNSKGRYTYGQAIESVVIPEVPTLDLTLTEVNKAAGVRRYALRATFRVTGIAKATST